MSENEQLIYSNPNFESCYLVTGLNESKELSFRIFPNPARDIIRIENMMNIEIVSITIRNITGQTVKHFDANKSELDVSELSPGLYFLNISYKNGVLSEKLIIE